MWHYTPEKRAKILFIISLLGTLFICFFTDANIIYIIDALIFTVIFLISYLICKKIDIRYADVITALVFFGGVAIVNFFNNSNLAFNIGIKDLENNMKPIIIEQCKDTCSIKLGTIYSNNKRIYELNYIHRIDEGTIYSDGKDISYTFFLDNKCIKKELKEKFEISNTVCEKNENF